MPEPALLRRVPPGTTWSRLGPQLLTVRSLDAVSVPATFSVSGCAPSPQPRYRLSAPDHVAVAPLSTVSVRPVSSARLPSEAASSMVNVPPEAIVVVPSPVMLESPAQWYVAPAGTFRSPAPINMAHA